MSGPAPATRDAHASARRTAAVPALAVLAALLLATGCRSARPPVGRPGEVQRGVASWYGPAFDGRLTACGEIYDMNGLTAAHPSLAFGTRVEVVNLDNGRRVVVRINDRGPYVDGRIVDLSYGAARQLGMVGPGTARVELRVLPGRAAPPPVSLAADTRYTVQVGAFRDAGRADELRSRLAARYPDAVVRSDGGWHRVQVGDYDWRRKAESLRRELRRAGYPALVVPLLPG